MVDIYRELNPSFVLTHALEDPYNFDHPGAAHFAQETRVVAQAMGHKPGAKYTYAAPPVFLFEPHQPEHVQFQAAGDPQHRRGLGHQAQDASKFSPRKSICGPITNGSRCIGACRAEATQARP